MKMIREDDDGIDAERSLTLHRSERGAQGVKVFRQEMTAAFQESDREKVGTAGEIGADIVRHEGEFAASIARSKGKP